MIIDGIISFFAVLVWDIITDYRKWLRNYQRVYHKRETWLRMALLAPAGVLLTLPLPWWYAFSVAPMLGFWFLLLFNGTYNKLRGFLWWHPGTSWIDGYLWNGSILSKIIVITGCIVSLIVYVSIVIKHA